MLRACRRRRRADSAAARSSRPHYSRREQSHADSVQEQDQREPGVREVDRQQRSGAESFAAARSSLLSQTGARRNGRTGSRTSVAIRKPAIRQHVDAGPERRLSKAVAVLGSQIPCSQMIRMNWSPPRPIAQQRSGIAGSEGADPKQLEVEHRLGNARLDRTEHREQSRAAELTSRARTATSNPSCGRRTAGSVGDPDHHPDQPSANVALPHQSIRGTAHAELAQRVVGPNGLRRCRRARTRGTRAATTRAPARHRGRA